MTMRHHNLNTQTAAFILSHILALRLFTVTYGDKGQVGQKIHDSLSDEDKDRVSPQQCQHAYLHFENVVKAHINNNTPWPSHIPGIRCEFHADEYDALSRDLGVWRSALIDIRDYDEHEQRIANAGVDQFLRAAAMMDISQEEQQSWGEHDDNDDAQHTDNDSADANNSYTPEGRAPSRTPPYVGDMNRRITTSD
ncbi:hypothetical protein H4S07_001010 [Coemansia furcata]|uniref:Uncharacterized protein n=1 Tax=Coemansia furcata TaxID=417177 RepID=A0ACC1LNK0_9FUNG|nr:hypothetical protein H4S07_001010 [Coemansia furcata]